MSIEPATNNPSPTVEAQPVQRLADQEPTLHGRHQMAAACANDWNAVHDAVGSFADEHSTL